MGFLWSRRWLGFFVVVLLLAALAVRLGDWQFNRLDERRAKNAETRTNLLAAPVPATQLVRVGRDLPDDREWRRVTATGTWDDAHSVVVRYQIRDEGPGVDVVTPLVTDSGDALVVDRGWMSVENTSAERPDTPAPATGEVTVTGYVRVDATGRSSTVDDRMTRAISSSRIAKTLPYPVYGGFVMLTAQTPRPTTTLGGPQLPELDDGPHFFYGLQWWFFGLLAVLGFCYLAYDERRQRREVRAVRTGDAPVSADSSPSAAPADEAPPRPAPRHRAGQSDDLVHTE